MTAHEILALARAQHPGVRYALDSKQQCLGAWNEALGRYQVIAGLLLGKPGQWCSMPYEILVNGAPVPLAWEE